MLMAKDQAKVRLPGLMDHTTMECLRMVFDMAKESSQLLRGTFTLAIGSQILSMEHLNKCYIPKI